MSNFPKPVWDIFDFKKVHLETPLRNPQDWKSKDSMFIKLANLNPRWRLWCNEWKQGGSVNIPMDPLIFNSFCEKFRRIILSGEKKTRELAIKGKNDLINRNQHDVKTVVARITYGRDSQGVCFIAVAMLDQNHIARFNFDTSFWAEDQVAGEKMPADECSEGNALGYLAALQSIVNTWLVVHGKEPHKPQKGGFGGGNQGGGNGGGFGGGGQQQQQSPPPASNFENDVNW